MGAEQTFKIAEDARLTHSRAESKHPCRKDTKCFLKGRRVAAHVRSYLRGKHTTLPEHMPESHRRHMQWTPGRLLNWGQKIGPGTRSVVQWQLENRPHPEQGYRACLGLLNLAKTYGEERLEAACRRALTLGSPTRKRILAILEAKLHHTRISSRPPIRLLLLPHAPTATCAAPSTSVPPPRRLRRRQPKETMKHAHPTHSRCTEPTEAARHGFSPQ